MTGAHSDPTGLTRRAGLRWTLLANGIAATSAVALVVGFYAFTVRNVWLLSILIPIGSLAIAMRLAIARVDRGDTTGAIRIYAASTWLVGVWVTLAVPFIWPTLMLTVLMPLVLAISYVQRRQLVVLILLSVVVVGAVAICGLAQPVTGVADDVREWSPWIRRTTVVATLTAVFVMVVVIVWQHHKESEAQAALLRDSRARLASVADEERRRIERDLHDGAQQRLVGVAVRLGLMSVQLEGAQAEAVDAMSEELAGAIEELRELAHGIYPPLLSNEGVGAALRAAARRSPLPTEVISEITSRFSTDIETALYFCGLEAMQNAAKHAGPNSSVRVHLHADESTIALRVVDDGGGGLPASMPSSGGLLNMADRIGAVGGSVEIGTSPTRGVEVVARVPIVPHDVGRA